MGVDAKSNAGGVANAPRQEGGGRPKLAIVRTTAVLRFAWPEELAALLGKIPDCEIARRAGIGLGTVAAERRRQGIPSFQQKSKAVEWTPEMIGMLGTAPDREVARELGISYHSVSGKRRILGIPAFHPRRNSANPPFPWTPEDLGLLGTMPDRQVAAELDISPSTVHFKRRRLGISSFCPFAPRIQWTEEMIDLLGKVPDREVAKRHGIGLKFVYMKRAALGIPPFHSSSGAVVLTPELAELLQLPNAEVQRLTGLSEQTLHRLREESGVPAPSLVDWLWKTAGLARLGKEPDAVIARDLGIPCGCVEDKRRSLGIPRFGRRSEEEEEEPEAASGLGRVERKPAHPRFVWTEELLALLGRLPDEELAKQAGVSSSTVLDERQRRGIAAFSPRRSPIEWTPEMAARLGAANDLEISRELRVPVRSVRRKRQLLGIPPFGKSAPVKDESPWSSEHLALLGKLSDKELGVRLGMSSTAVNRKRQELGIPPSRPPGRIIQWTDEILDLLGKAPDSEVAARFGMSAYSAFRKRKRLGIPPFKDTRSVVRTPELADLLRLPTREIRKRTRISRETIRQLRQEFGIERPE